MRRVLAVGIFGCLGAACVLGPDDGLSSDDDGGPVTAEGLPQNEYCDPVSVWEAEEADAELRVVELVNEARARGGVCGEQSLAATGPLAMNGALRCAARVHSLDMSERGFFDHVNPDGESPGDRIHRAGYSWFTAGENIAAGQPTPEDVVAGWLASPGHCLNILSPDFAEIGVGYVVAPASPYPHYWTQTFGAR